MLTTSPRLYIRRPSPTTAEFTVTTCPPLTIPLRLLLLALLLLRGAVLLAAVLALYSRFFASSSSPSPSSSFPVSASSSSTSTSSGVSNNPNPNDDTDSQSPPPHQHQHQHQQQLQQLQLFLSLLLAGDAAGFVASALRALHGSRAGAALARAVGPPLPGWAVALACALAAYLAACRPLHTTESVLVLRGLGIQTRSCRSSWFAVAGGGGGGGGCNGGGGSGSIGGGLFGLMSGSWLSGSGFGWGQQTRFIPTEKIRDVLINEAFRGFEVRYYLVVVVEGEEEVVVLFPGLLPRRKIVEAVWRGVRECLFEEQALEGVGREKG